MAVNLNTYVEPSFSILNRIERTVWGLVYVIFFLPSPKPFHTWRAFLLRLFGAKIGKGVHVYPKVKIWLPRNLVINDFVGVANGSILYNQGKIVIGSYSIISQGVHLCAGTHDYTKKGHPLITAPIIIGDRVWVCADSFVHPAITIQDGAVIGARSVVTKDMPAWMVCAGHPCKPIKQRIIVD